MKKLPKWKVLLSHKDSMISEEVEGYLENLKTGGIQFVNINNDVIKAYAFGRWLEITSLDHEN